MDENRFEARDYLNRLQKSILVMACYREDRCVGRGHALILNGDDRVAIMLEDCGDPAESGIRAGNLVNYIIHPEVSEPKIVGNPASIRI
jgi:hypothetical protein